MKLRQLEVRELVRQMITYNKVALEAESNIGDLLKDQPSGCIIPETRKSDIFTKFVALNKTQWEIIRFAASGGVKVITSDIMEEYRKEQLS